MDKPKEIDVFKPEEYIEMQKYFYQLGYIRGCNDTLKEEIEFHKNERQGDQT